MLEKDWNKYCQKRNPSRYGQEYSPDLTRIKIVELRKYRIDRSIDTVSLIAESWQ